MPSKESRANYSLFAGDNLNRIFARLGMRSEGALGIVSRSCFLWFLTWIPPAILFWCFSYEPDLEPRNNFFRDVAGLGQCFLGYPLFLYAEWKINKSTSSSLRTFVERPVIDERDKASFQGLLTKLHKLRTLKALDLTYLLLAYIFSWLWISAELQNGVSTWHARLGEDGQEHMTWAGIWAALIGVPIYNYWWLRFIGKCSLWSWILWKISRLRLLLVPTHPDRTAGLYFISKTQTSFGAAIFAFGVSAVAATLGHKLVIEQASPLTFAVWGPLLGYILLAPLVFTLPLFAFTPHLKELKQKTEEQFNRQLAVLSRRFEEKWLYGKKETIDLAAPEISAMADINSAYSTVEKLRVVPFDFESGAKLIASTVSPFLPLAHWLGLVPPQIQEFGSYVKEIIESLNWHG